MVAAQCLATGVPASAALGTSTVRARLGGNPALQPETARVGTLGVMVEPARGLDVTLGYWRIDLDDAIAHLPVPLILSQCYAAGNPGACDQIHRDPVDHRITDVVDTIRNIGGVTTSGLDFSAAYGYRNSYGAFRHAIEGTYLFQYNLDTGTRDAQNTEQIVHGRGFYDLGVLPDLKLDLATTWAHPSGLGAGVSVRFIDGYRECEHNRCNDPANLRRDVASYATGDLFVSFHLNTRQGTTSIAAGMNNVTSAVPPTIYNAPASDTDASAYDFLGRQFYVRLNQRF
jgi:outer membrane receptor for ferrienterochelin and colicin